MLDTEILQLYWQRDEKALTETAASYGPYCRTIANAILHSSEDTEECWNDTLFRAWNAIPPARPNSLRAFLAKICRNLAYDRYRSKNAKKRGNGVDLILDELEECIPSSASPADDAEAKELGVLINRFLGTLSERDRAVMVRRCFYAETTSQIAKKYGLKESHVLVILSRTRKKLKEYLTREWGGT